MTKALTDFAAMFANLTDTECDFMDSPLPHLDGFAIRDLAQEAAPDQVNPGGVLPGRGPTMWAGSGFLHVLNPSPDEIHLVDIARGLSRVPRFNGHTRIFYSVAQHSIFCEWRARDLGLPVELRRLALLHDATESYIMDLVSPVKGELPDYRHLESRLWRAIAARFRLSAEIPAEIKAIDREARATEVRDLLPDEARAAPDWQDLPAPLARRVSAGYAPNFTAAEFLTVARRLGLS